MASNLSRNIVDQANKDFYGSLYNNKFFNINNLLIFIVQKKIRLKNILLSILREIYILILKDNLINPKQKAYYRINSIDIKNLAIEFKNKNFTYSENFLDNESLKILIETWPNSLFFKYPNEPIKNYNFGFRVKLNYEIGSFEGFEGKLLKYNYNLNKFYEFLKSSEMSKLINKIVGSNGYRCVSATTSTINGKGFLAPHTDSIGKNNEIINLVFFIDGSEEPEYSGGTGIYEDNEFKKKIFIPPTINNSFIIYNSTTKFYHGFKRVRPGKYRYAITAQFSSKQ